jgi:Tol biopolymer transport system component
MTGVRLCAVTLCSGVLFGALVAGAGGTGAATPRATLAVEAITYYGPLVVQNRYAVFLVGLPQRKKSRLTADNICWDPAWSPDGRLLALSCGNAIWVMDVASRRRSKVSRNDGTPKDQEGAVAYDFDPSWSADGGTLVFVRRRAERAGAQAATDLWTVDVQTRKEHRLTRSLGLERCPRWSPDGLQLAFLRAPDDSAEPTLLIGTASATNSRVIARGLDGYCISWSPDSERVAFSKNAVYAVDTATREQQKLTSHGSEPTWSPDGEWLAFSDVEPKTGQFQGIDTVYVRRVAGGPTIVAARHASNPAWRP